MGVRLLPPKTPTDRRPVQLLLGAVLGAAVLLLPAGVAAAEDGDPPVLEDPVEWAEGQPSVPLPAAAPQTAPQAPAAPAVRPTPRAPRPAPAVPVAPVAAAPVAAAPVAAVAAVPAPAAPATPAAPVVRRPAFAPLTAGELQLAPTAPRRAGGSLATGAAPVVRQSTAAVPDHAGMPGSGAVVAGAALAAAAAGVLALRRRRSAPAPTGSTPS